MLISSANNPRIKNVISLYDRKPRNESGLFLIEGSRELALALKNKIVVETIYYCAEIALDNQILKNFAGQKQEVSRGVFEKMTYRGTTEGFLAVAVQPKVTLSTIKLPTNPFIVVLEQVEKPGNIGAVLRTADAGNVDLVIIADQVTDLYNPNIVRASLGSLFTVPVICAETAVVINWLKQHKVKIITSTPHTAKPFTQIDMRTSCAAVIGSEKEGVTKPWLDNADQKALIPMFGNVDSLNAATSAALFIYEAVRQRNLTHLNGIDKLCL